MINANNDSYKYELLLVFLLYRCNLLRINLLFLNTCHYPLTTFFTHFGIRYTPIRQVTITGE